MSGLQGFADPQRPAWPRRGRRHAVRINRLAFVLPLECFLFPLTPSDFVNRRRLNAVNADKNSAKKKAIFLQKAK